MSEKLEIDTKKLFIQLFNIFEKELLDIFEYVAPTEENQTTYGNRIHELLLRIGAEVENIAKGVCFYIAENEKGSTDWIENASSKDFLKFLIKNTSINMKTIQFTAGLESGGNKYLIPFSSKEWRDHYDILKHGKINNYNICNLGDVIMAFGGYFILLNYFLLGYNNTQSCNSILTINPSKNLGINSSIFTSTCTFDKNSYEIHLLEGDRPIINGYQFKKHQEALQKKEITLPENINLTKHQYLFYTCFRITPIISSYELFNIKTIMPPIEQMNQQYQLTPEFGFIN